MKSTMAKKRLVSVCLAVMMVASIGAIGVSADNNYKNSKFVFNFSPDSSCYTGARQKLDNTSAWMRCDSAEKAYYAHVVAEPDTNNTKIDVSRSPDTGTVYNYYFSTNTTHYMKNWAKEEGYNWAGILASSASNYYDSASGVWSPDSI